MWAVHSAASVISNQPGVTRAGGGARKGSRETKGISKGSTAPVVDVPALVVDAVDVDSAVVPVSEPVVLDPTVSVGLVVVVVVVVAVAVAVAVAVVVDELVELDELVAVSCEVELWESSVQPNAAIANIRRARPGVLAVGMGPESSAGWQM